MRPERKVRKSGGGPIHPMVFAFSASLLAGILVAWEPRYWHVAVALASVSLISVVWAVTARGLSLPWQTALVGPVAAWGFLQMAFHSTVVQSMTMRAAIVWAACLAVFVLGSQILRGRRDRDLFVNVMLWALTALGACAVLQAYSTPIRVFGLFAAEPSVVGTMFYKNQFAALMELGAPIALWRVMQGRVLAGGTCYAIMFAATVTSLSRAGVILVLAELLVFLAVMIFGRRLGVKPALAIAGVMALLIVGASLVAGTDVIRQRMEETNPYHMREQLADSTFRMIAARPWFGFGIGTWRAAYPAFATLDMAVIANEAHNDWAQWGSEGGVPFLLLLAALTLCLTRRALESVWGMGLLAVMAHCYVDYSMREPALQLVWFGLAGALTQYETETHSE
jgi:O-antigen ligase